MTSWTYTGGELGMYILQAWYFYLDWLFFMLSLFGLWLESKCFFPGLKPSVWCCLNMNFSVVSWFIQQVLFLKLFIFMPSQWCEMQQSLSCLAVVLLMLEASWLRQSPVLQQSHLFFCLQERLTTSRVIKLQVADTIPCLWEVFQEH